MKKYIEYKVKCIAIYEFDFGGLAVIFFLYKMHSVFKY